MSVEVKTHPDHPASMAERVSNRLRNSGAGAMPNVTVQKGEGPTRTHTNIHHAGHYTQPNTAAKPTEGLVNKRDASLVGGGGDGR
jgi:hypothetical protein